MAEDLFYRIQVIRLALPSLRGRREDIPLPIDHFIDVVAEVLISAESSGDWI